MRFRAAPGMDLRLLEEVLPEGYTGSEGPAGQYTVEGTIDPQVLAAVTAWCARQGVLADDVRVGRRSLEDVFLDLTGRELRP
jgi:ABC-2 type transport system ATP-binding protein